MRFTASALVPRGKATAIKGGQVVWIGSLGNVGLAPKGSVIAINPEDYLTLRAVTKIRSEG